MDDRLFWIFIYIDEDSKKTLALLSDIFIRKMHHCGSEARALGGEAGSPALCSLEQPESAGV